jgi:hypothetical protein
MAVGMLPSCDLPPCGLAADVYFSKLLVHTLIFRKSKKKNIKKSEGDKDVNYKAHEGLKQPT